MKASDVPGEISVPFANAGSKNTIPVSTATTGLASYDAGFPAITFQDLAAGGQPPFGKDFNGILYALSANIRWNNAAGVFPYSSSFSTAIGGYPKGAIVSSSANDGFWFSSVDDNTTDPSTDTSGKWLPWNAQGYSAVALAGSNVTLTPDQYASPTIELTGTLTSNVQVTFPQINGIRWRVHNNTSGAYTITLKCASGNLITVDQGLTAEVRSDGTSLQWDDNDLYALQALRSTDSSKGAALVGLPNGTVADALFYVTPQMFGAKADGVTDDTAAFNAAINSNHMVFVPIGEYSVSNVVLYNNARVVGESRILTKITVNTNNTSAFLARTGTQLISNITLKNMRIQPAPGITGAKAYSQTDKSNYTAYAYFELETDLGLHTSFDGLFIYSEFHGRDGYVGLGVSGQQHCFINGNPATAGQSNTSNVVRVYTRTFNAPSNTPAVIDISNAADWHIAGSFEGHNCPIIKGFGVSSLFVEEGTWIERITASHIIEIGQNPNLTNPKYSTTALHIDSITAQMYYTTGYFVVTDAYCRVSVSRSRFTNVASGVKFIDDVTRINKYYGNYLLMPDPGGEKFFSDMYERTTYIELTEDAINSPDTKNQNLLGTGTSNVAASALTNNLLTSVTNVSSQIGLVGKQAVKFVTSASGGIAYFSLDPKIVDFLKGKIVTFALSGTCSGGTSGNYFLPTMWDSVTPGGNNGINLNPTSIRFPISNTGLQTQYFSYIVRTNSTSLAVGVAGPPGNTTDAFFMETWALYLGVIKPVIVGID